MFAEMFVYERKETTADICSDGLTEWWIIPENSARTIARFRSGRTVHMANWVRVATVS